LEFIFEDEQLARLVTDELNYRPDAFNYAMNSHEILDWLNKIINKYNLPKIKRTSPVPVKLLSSFIANMNKSTEHFKYCLEAIFGEQKIDLVDFIYRHLKIWKNVSEYETLLAQESKKAGKEHSNQGSPGITMEYNPEATNEASKSSIHKNDKDNLLWKVILKLLMKPEKYETCLKWINREKR